MLLGLSRPSRGSARVCGLDPIRKAREVKGLVGYLPENVGFYQDLNAVQSLEYIANLNGMDRGKTQEKISEVLDIVELSDEKQKRLGAYSRGMKQRLGIAEVLLKDPRVMFLDEPTLGLDPDGAQKIINLIKFLNEDRKISVLVSSHHLQQVQKISHRVGMMIKGKMVAEGSIGELAKEKFGVDGKEYSLEEIYMKYFQEV
jgi:ABC-2 type transport system ATP-binding protein